MNMKRIILILIVGLLYSCEDIIGVEDISDRTVTILAPTNHAELTITNPTFSWNSVDDADKYKLQIATPSFSEALQIVEDTTLTTLSFTKILEAGDYEWRVRAENSDYETDYTTQQLTILE